MELSELTAITPLDGRYASKSAILRPIFSEYGLLKQRVTVEIAWIKTLANTPEITEVTPLSQSVSSSIDAIVDSFGIEDARRIKAIEQTTNHDVKAVEYFIKEKFDDLKIEQFKEFIHFGLTSQDINNTAIPLSIKESLEDIYYPAIDELIKKLEELSEEYRDLKPQKGASLLI